MEERGPAAEELAMLQKKKAKEALDIAYHMSNLLHAGLDRHTLSILIALCENGVNPEALAAVVKELRREAAALGGNKGS